MVKKKKGHKLKKERLKPISFYPFSLEEVISAFLKVDPKKIKDGNLK